MRRFGLGCLLMNRDSFGETRLGDFLDAMTGYNERENERTKTLAEIIRTSTTILYNKHIGEGNAIDAHDLWEFPWDAQVKDIVREIPQEERETIDKKLEEAIVRHGNRNKQS